VFFLHATRVIPDDFSFVEMPKGSRRELPGYAVRNAAIPDCGQPSDRTAVRRCQARLLGEVLQRRLEKLSRGSEAYLWNWNTARASEISALARS